MIAPYGSDEVPLGLGRALMTFAHLEMMLEYYVSMILFRSSSHEDEGHILGNHMSYSGKVNAFATLYRYRFPEEQPWEALNEVEARLRDAGRERNRLVHDEWSAAYEPGHATRMSVRRRGNPFGEGWLESVSLEELEGTFQRADTALSDFMGKRSMQIRDVPRAE